MKITRLETLRIEEFPSVVYVRLHTDEGLIGLGETFFFADAVEAHLHDVVAGYVIGKDSVAIEQHAEALRGYVGSAGSGAETRAASAVDIALWDLRGKELGQPLHALLGGASRERIRTYNTCAGYRYVRGRRAQAVTNWGLPDGGEQEGPYEDLDAFLHRADDLARDLLASGITGMKIWPFDPCAEASLGHHISGAELERALEPFRKIRAAVGHEMDVMVELHALWDVPAARRIVHALQEIEPFWIEDPVRVTSPAALAEVARSTSAPIAAGETLSGLPAFREAIAGGNVQIVIFDVGWVGGITAARKVAALAAAYELPVAPHDCTGPVVYTAATHLSLHLPNAIVQESVRAFASGWYAELVTALPAIEAGLVGAPPGSGLGLELRPEVFERPDVRIRLTSEEDMR
jgi:galactonate dehydratase